MNICNADIHKAVDMVRVGDAKRYRRLVGSRASSDIEKEPGICNLNVRRGPIAIACAQNLAAEDCFVVVSRSADIGDGKKMCDSEPLLWGHLITPLLDLCAAHWRLRFQYFHFDVVNDCIEKLPLMKKNKIIDLRAIYLSLQCHVTVVIILNLNNLTNGRFIA
jgi:hypothetical protein